ncbi:hypothetical protein R6U77_02585 [Lysinibacillus louembei]|uniref:Sigma-70 family RNA polymerase sigma factor n=1 Tax=Lysinibacillus louembei TaxID=1470088 RepID=A0ABZ0S0P7_9BACI|nr:hypothetical protein [Lysinibacillus louembei]WPK12603.1 hypothetical protein R6U77_02585 [Lysinibacillus louembei]
MYEWLKDYQQLEDEISYFEQNLSRSKKELQRWMHGDLAKYKLTAESDGARLEERIEIIEYELAHKLNDLYDLEQLIKKFKGIEQKIIYGKYIEGKTLEHVAEDLGYSAQYIYTKHSQIKRLMKFHGAS